METTNIITNKTNRIIFKSPNASGVGLLYLVFLRTSENFGTDLKISLECTRSRPLQFLIDHNPINRHTARSKLLISFLNYRQINK